ncbi:hypothetical protein AJ87_45005 [Rhizobium yanglingense]|nr:hypothetical protein AJ87_45005 [Rhizobium yanglingense]
MTADIADLHLAIRPDSDVALFLGLFEHLIANNAIDQNYVAEHTNGFAEAFASASGVSFNEVLELTGLPAMQLRESIASSRRPRRPSPATARVSTNPRQGPIRSTPSSTVTSPPDASASRAWVPSR